MIGSTVRNLDKRVSTRQPTEVGGIARVAQ